MEIPKKSILRIFIISWIFICAHESYALKSQVGIGCGVSEGIAPLGMCQDMIIGGGSLFWKNSESILREKKGNQEKEEDLQEKQDLSCDINDRIVLSAPLLKKRILRYKMNHEAVTYAWEQWKDLDFILMIQEESLWEEFIFGDSGTSIGYCQFSKIHGRELYEKYIKAPNWKDRINLCHEHYNKFYNQVGVVFHGWNTRKRNLPSFTFR